VGASGGVDAEGEKRMDGAPFGVIGRSLLFGGGSAVHQVVLLSRPKVKGVGFSMFNDIPLALVSILEIS
jgi:hypothetical protein